MFKKKSNGIYRARLVACGYSQIEGIDYTESFNPVVNDVTWKILIILAMKMGLDIRLLDVETAFQNGDLDKEIYMEPPEGIEEVNLWSVWEYYGAGSTTTLKDILTYLE